MDGKKANGEPDDDTYIIEDSGGSVEELEREMEETAREAVAATAPPDTSQGDENQQLRDRYLRTLADFDNYRKRSDREKADFFKHALANVFREILPVLDNFDRALDHAEQGDDFHKGVLLIYKQLFNVLEKHGLRPIEESGVHFDPNIHEAVVREEDSSVANHTVVAVLQKGYFLHDRLLRPAMVKVAVGGPEE
ncbi:MAG TPA: nucleotide exchange factor GrpE [Thermoanaerobaculia bacterium]|nr:nucleotide exchange factor GrpE [Thermoanaerobaculia bacterium]